MSKKTRSKIIDVIGVPLDLGANIRGANMGPSAVRMMGLRDGIENLGFQVADQGDIAVPVREELSAKERENHYLNTIAKICDQLSVRVKSSLEQERFPLVIGGDHSIAIGTISGVSSYLKKQKDELAIVWVDAHADLNNPRTTPSGNIHGMPLSIVLGDGHEQLVQIGFNGPKVKPSNVALIGLRNIDGKEKEQVRKSGIHYFTMRSLDERGMFRVMQEALEAIKAPQRKIHLSFDLDAVDPLFAPGVSTPVSGGISYREAHLMLEMLSDTGKLISAEFVEANPASDQSFKTALLTVEFVLSALGKSIV